MMSTFLTISEAGEAETKDKGSRFIGFARRVNSNADVERELQNIREIHPKARHYCYAYYFNENDYRANDDGEPGGSAGLPILNQIKSAELQNVLVVVVRYFGGTLLGVSGLIHNYKGAAGLALENSKIQECVPTNWVDLNFHYGHMEEVMSFIKTKNYDVVDKIYRERCTLTIECPTDDCEQLNNDLPNCKIQIHSDE